MTRKGSTWGKHSGPGLDENVAVALRQGNLEHADHLGIKETSLTRAAGMTEVARNANTSTSGSYPGI